MGSTSPQKEFQKALLFKEANRKSPKLLPFEKMAEKHGDVPIQFQGHLKFYLCSSSGFLMRLKRIFNRLSLSLASGCNMAVHRIRGINSYKI